MQAKRDLEKLRGIRSDLQKEIDDLMELIKDRTEQRKLELNDGMLLDFAVILCECAEDHFKIFAARNEAYNKKDFFVMNYQMFYPMCESYFSGMNCYKKALEYLEKVHTPPSYQKQAQIHEELSKRYKQCPTRSNSHAKDAEVHEKKAKELQVKYEKARNGEEYSSGMSLN
jgi:hypothetical protein